MGSLADELPVYSSPSSLVHLPRNLQKPSYKEISRDVLAGIEPGLRDVPVEYVKRGIAQQSQEMLAAISAVSASVPKSIPRANIPASIPATASPACPTHVLAVASASSPGSVTLIPTHHLVLAAHCANVPALPAAAPGRAAIPVVPLTVPSASTFPLLHAYLYTKRLDTLLTSLLPVPAQLLPAAHQVADTQLMRAASHHLAATAMFSADHMTRYVALVHALWKNVVALGVFDKELWQALDLAWEVVVGAVHIANGARQ
ncbi:hypothetical protein NEOLEDRAFT_1155904 [Neolentinus lepideus HHB14362 ss-1]|uniref:Clp1-like protein n=1 Tax=Neolentinus lepideus HHB14362 ss-1 TaxID=1314782 RepID=A0A165T1J1_9AGAM|nr:hypothetical protein NEOLEDRAFT_1155904 [Neolentinus lepideus HHB14362 ss-1]